MNITLVSLDIVWENKDANKNICDQVFDEIYLQKSDLIIFPEMSLTGFSMNAHQIAEEENSSNTIEYFANHARKAKVGIIFGMATSERGKYYNSLIYLDKSGNIAAKYNKIHPFSLAGEDKVFSAGRSLISIRYRDVTIGFTICYDLRFPEIYSALSRNCDMIINIANWPSKRIEHWNTLLKARSIENQIIMVGVNRVGKDGNGLEYEKSSQVIDANGRLIKSLKSSDFFEAYSISLEDTKALKRSFSTTQDRIPNFYKSILK